MMITIEALTTAISQRIEQYNQSDNPIQQRATQTVTLAESLGHVLAESIRSPYDVPRQNVSAMDGFAIAIGSPVDTNDTVQIIGESKAGQPFDGQINAGQGVRIYTGAVVPAECDTVVMQENTNLVDIRDTIADQSQPYAITLTQPAQIGRHIRRQGEEIQTNEQVLSQGKRINPADISLLAAIGIDSVTVYQPITVGLLATGDELVAVGGNLDTPAQIYNSNTPTLKSLYHHLPINLVDYGIVPDNINGIRRIVEQASKDCDVLISTAGVSVGDYDYLTTIISELGQINHYKVAMKPGKPFVFGELPKTSSSTDSAMLYFGLPGNPLSAVVGSLQFVIPAIWQLSGTTPADIPQPLMLSATLTTQIRKSAGRTDLQRGILSQQTDGRYQVKVLEQQQSHRIKQLSQANCLVVLPQDSENLQAGEQVQVRPFSWYMA